MIRRPPRSTLDRSSAASDVYKRQVHARVCVVGRRRSVDTTGSRPRHCIAQPLTCGSFDHDTKCGTHCECWTESGFWRAVAAGIEGITTRSRALMIDNGIAYLWGMTPKQSRKPPVSQEERLLGLIASFSIEGIRISMEEALALLKNCLLYTSPSPRDRTRSRMPSSAWKNKNTTTHNNNTNCNAQNNP